MSKHQEYTENLLSQLYKSKQENRSRKEVNKLVQELIKNEPTGMFEVINNLNSLGYTHIIAKRGIGNTFFTTIPEDYLTLKGAEYFESLKQT